ncbi:LamB/YcsF family protein [Rubrobacter indicoceani]|uniref:LamB/YcsF family protein n=1 Tax=Rubrobacter indicoceani TaxID=2051957 RepID=UPI000E5B2ECB|nr:5-oxoprolinase subunit PxpA [Rubrobacter indicoceani]
MHIDLNCDMGESFGHWRMGHDEGMMKHISSANVAGGFHAGDPHTMRKTVRLAKENGVAVGVHSGYRDLVGFGRRELDVSPDEIHDELIYQLGALREFCRLHDTEVQHVKPHGALYMVAARDEELSRAIVEAIQRVDPELHLFCMRESVTYRLGRELGQPVIAEFFADRAYNDEGQIVFTRAVTEELNPEEVGDRVVRAVTEGRVTAESGNDVEVASDSVCVHGDTPGAVELAGAIARKLHENDIEVRPLGRAGQRV